MLLKYCVLELDHHQLLDLYRTQAEKTAILHCQQSSMTAALRPNSFTLITGPVSPTTYRYRLQQ